MIAVMTVLAIDLVGTVCTAVDQQHTSALPAPDNTHMSGRLGFVATAVVEAQLARQTTPSQAVHSLCAQHRHGAQACTQR